MMRIATRAGRVDTIKTLKQAIQMFCGDRFTHVGDGYDRMLMPLANGNGDRGIRFCMVSPIFQQVCQ